VSVSGRLVDAPIDPADLIAEVSASSNGAVLLFLGLVRETNEGRDVTGIEYSAYEAMAERELAAIAEECAANHGVNHVVIVHRLGELALQEASVGIAVGHPHRAEAYEASRWIIEELKRRVPIWKREHYVDGTREWVGQTRKRMTPRSVAIAEEREPAPGGR
jgi:molybdopterin synthase catalytic subunit